jgi:hypothetical protein
LTRCCSQNLQALAATSVEDAAKLHAVASSTLQLLLELPTAEQTTKLKQLDELITALLTQLRAAAESLQAAPQGDPQLSSPKVDDLLKALVQLRKLGGRLVAARTFLGAVFAASAARAAAGSAPAADCRAEMVRLVRASLSAAGRPVDQAEEADEEVAFAEDGLTYCGAFVPIGERCAVSLLPLKSLSLLPLAQLDEAGGLMFGGSKPSAAPKPSAGAAAKKPSLFGDDDDDDDGGLFGGAPKKLPAAPPKPPAVPSAAKPKGGGGGQFGDDDDGDGDGGLLGRPKPTPLPKQAAAPPPTPAPPPAAPPSPAKSS